VLDALHIAPGSTAADLGAGTGYFSLRLARRVGPSGRVLAVDIQEEMLHLLAARLREERVENVEGVLATETDPHLPSRSVDLVLMVDVYHELSKPAEVLRRVKESLRPAEGGRRAGRLVLVEYRGEDPAVPIKPLHRMTLSQVRAEVEPFGFRSVKVHEFLPHQRVLVFESL
jgi:ubiquinone/menaquinone biosynthesis C-methylase UbiE